MNIAGCILVILIIAGLYYIYGMAQIKVGGALPAINMSPTADPYYNRQYKELDDVNNVLNRKVVKGKDNINELHPWNEDCDLNGKLMTQLKLLEPWKRYLDFSDIERAPNSPELKALVEDKQPYFLDEALIIDYYGEKFYNDANYPRHPISVEFAKDPAKFCKENPNVYPSYVIGAHCRSSRLRGVPAAPPQACAPNPRVYG
jgi:hypothetical protein